ncbi:hypothetical protein CGRA01v4_00003 [Colletotrichum graminicola]|nr:hypothetical protein CGRA01v4_00003 [Colletotrichum graminicola]
MIILKNKMFIILLLYCLAAFVSASWLPPLNFATRDTSFTFDNTFWVNEGRFSCTSEQKASIIAAIAEAQFLSKGVVQALSVKNAEKSKAFLTWFGRGNASPQMKSSIIQHNYQSLINNLITPKLPIKVDKIDANVPSPATRYSLIYACSPENFEVRSIKMYAKTSTPIADHPYPGPTYVTFYPIFFEKETGLTIQETAKQWKLDKKLESLPSRSLLLIHEFQHMWLATGPDRFCIDVPDPEHNGQAACYSISCCMSVADNLKIKNAQNFANFAAYIYTWPKTAKAPWLKW